ncbi:MAG: hypothetical protein RR397_08710 [Odoribacter sp.]
MKKTITLSIISFFFIQAIVSSCGKETEYVEQLPIIKHDTIFIQDTITTVDTITIQKNLRDYMIGTWYYCGTYIGDTPVWTVFQADGTGKSCSNFVTSDGPIWNTTTFTWEAKDRYIIYGGNSTDTISYWRNNNQFATKNNKHYPVLKMLEYIRVDGLYENPPQHYFDDLMEWNKK